RRPLEAHPPIAVTEDVLARYDAYGGHVQNIAWTNGDTEYLEDVDALADAIAAAKANTSQPSFIRLRTIMAWPSPGKQDTAAAHGAKLGEDEVTGLKEALGIDPAASFSVDADVLDHTRALRDRGAQQRSEWQGRFDAWRAENPDRA